MKEFINSLFLILIIVMLPSAGCTGNKTRNDQKIISEASKNPVVIPDESSKLLKYLQENGDYVTSREFPSLIKASAVNEELGKNILVIDLRSPEQFSEGHIKGAVNKKFEELPSYLETGIRPFEYDKIILVSNDGQVSSYTASLLRLMGYGNVYSMRWGMSAWNISYANQGWLKGVSGKYETGLEVKDNEKPVSQGMPELKTGLTNGEDIADARFRKVFSEGTANILISADEVFKNPQNYFMVNLERKDKFDDGHIPGAVRYKPGATLGFPDELASIPSGKTVVVYCGTGHNSGFATAYLRLFGYDARTLKYGNNGFMYDKMVKQKTALSWLPFTTAEVNDFKVVK